MDVTIRCGACRYSTEKIDALRLVDVNGLFRLDAAEHAVVEPGADYQVRGYLVLPTKQSAEPLYLRRQVRGLCRPRNAVTDYARANGLKDFSFLTMAAVPTPRFLSTEARFNWPLRKAAVLPAVRAIPRSIRHIAIRHYYRETELMLAALEQFGPFEVYFDGCKILVRHTS